MSYKGDFDIILNKENTIKNATMFVLKNDRPNIIKVFPKEISTAILVKYFNNLRQTVRDNDFVSYIPDSIQKGTLQVITTRSLNLWDKIIASRDSIQNINNPEIVVSDYNCAGNVILMDIEFEDDSRVYFLTVYRNVAAWYSNNVRFTKKETGKFHEETGDILALTPYVDVVISGERCFIIHEENFNKIFKYDEVIKNQVATHETEIRAMNFIGDADRFMRFLNNSKRQKKAMAKVILQNRLKKIEKYTATYIREQIENQPQLSYISYTNDDKIIIDEKSFKAVVGILCGSINLDLITKELNGLDENE